MSHVFLQKFTSLDFLSTKDRWDISTSLFHNFKFADMHFYSFKFAYSLFLPHEFTFSTSQIHAKSFVNSRFHYFKFKDQLQEFSSRDQQVIYLER